MEKPNREPLFPRNRREVFLDLLSHHKLEIEKGNLWSLLFALPSLLLAYGYYVFSGLLPTLIEKGLWSLPLVDGVSMGESLYLFQIRNVLFACLTLTNILLFLGLGGLYRLIQDLCFEKNAGESQPFFIGVKANAKEFVLSSLLFSAVCFFVNLVISYYSQDFSSWISIVSIVIASVLLFMAAALLFIALPLFNLYRGSFFSLFKAAFILLYRSFFRNFGFLLLALFPVFCYLVPSLLFTSIFSILMVFFFLPYFVLLAVLNVDYLADRFINEGRFPSLINKGIHPRG